MTKTNPAANPWLNNVVAEVKVATPRAGMTREQQVSELRELQLSCLPEGGFLIEAH